MHLEDIITMQKTQTVKFILFWGHTQKYISRVDKSCLSKWYRAPFEEDGKIYPTVEHYMMAAKARLFGDSEIEEQILRVKQPNEARKLGYLVKNYEDDVWAANRLAVVKRANELKFASNHNLRQFLLSTNGKVLAEASPVDRIWGIGLPHSHQDAMNAQKWRGQNLLGIALMLVRDELLAEENADALAYELEEEQVLM